MNYIHQIRRKMIAFELKNVPILINILHSLPFLYIVIVNQLEIHYINIFCCYDLDT